MRLKKQKAELQRKQQQIEFKLEFQQQKQQHIELERGFQQKQPQIKFELRQAELDAEEQMLNLSNPNSVLSALSQNQQQVYKPFAHTQPRKRLGHVTPKHIEDFANAQPHAQSYRPQVESTANAKSTPLRHHRGYPTQREPYPQNRVPTFQNQEY